MLLQLYSNHKVEPTCLLDKKMKGRRSSLPLQKIPLPAGEGQCEVLFCSFLFRPGLGEGTSPLQMTLSVPLTRCWSASEKITDQVDHIGNSHVSVAICIS